MMMEAPFRNDGGGDPHERKVEETYLKELMTLKLNSKPLINSLTMMAEDFITSAHVVVATIEKQLQRVRPDCKLPILYLIDSIVKNIKKEYIQLFTQNIVSTFTSVFEKVDDRTRSQMFKLRQTWNEIFPIKKLQAIDLRIHQIDAGWPVTTNSNTIHLNPIFLNRHTPLSLPSPLSQSQQQPSSSYEQMSSSPISLLEPPGEAAEAQMREQLLIKQKQLIELQQKKLQLELLQTQTQLEEARRKKLHEENQKQQLLNKAEFARQQTLAAASMIATYAPTPTTSSDSRPFSNDPRLNRYKSNPVPEAPPPPVITRLLTQQSSTSTPVAPQPPVVKKERLSPLKSESGKSGSSNKSSPKPQVVQPEVKRRDNPVTVSVTVKKEELSPVKKETKHNTSRELSPVKKETKHNTSRDKEKSARSSSSKDSSSSSRVKSEKLAKSEKPVKAEKSDKDKSHGKGSSSSSSSSGSRKRTSKDTSRSPVKNITNSKEADPIDEEDEEHGFSGITIKPHRRDSPVVAPSVSKSKSPSLGPSSSSTSKERASKEEPHKSPSSKSTDRVSSSNSRSKDRRRPPTPSSQRDSRNSSKSTKSSVTARPSESDHRDNIMKRQSTVMSRNYRKRSDTTVMDGEDEGEGDVSTTDVDLRFDLLRDVDLRESSPPASKKSKTASLIDNLFGREDVDLRQSQSSNWSQVKKQPRQSLESSAEEEITRPPSAISPASSVGSTCDPLGRPLLYTRLPDDPDLRRRSLGSRSSSVDPLESFRFRYIEKPSRENGQGGLSAADLKVAFVRVKEELEAGKLNDNQYNLIIKQLIQINETSKIREVQQMDIEMKPGGSPQTVGPNNLPNPWTQAGNPFNPPMSVVRPTVFRPRGPSQPDFVPPAWSGQAPFNLQQPRGPNPFIEAAAAVGPPQAPVLQPPMNMIPIANPRDVAQLELEFDSTIPLDKIPRIVRFYGPIAIVLVGAMGDEPRQISFQTESAPRTVNINREPINVRIGQMTSFYLGRKKHTIQIGAPTRELYIDGIGYEVCFGGAPVQILHDGEWLTIRLQGLPPSVEIGTVKRYDLVAGRTTIIIEGNPIPLFLDAKAQLVDFCGISVVLRFCEEFHTVTLNGRPFPTNFGGPPRPLILPDGRVVNIRFTAISRVTEQNMIQHIRLQKLGPLPPDDVLLSDGPSAVREGRGGRGRGGRGGRGARIETVHPEMLESSNNRGIVDPFDLLANSLQPVTNPNDQSSSYRTESGIPQKDTKNSQPALQQPSQALNVQDLVSKLMMAGLLPANVSEAASGTTSGPPSTPTPADTKADQQTPVEAAKAETSVVPNKPFSISEAKCIDVTFKDNLKERRQGLIDRIYDGIQCGACGLRFDHEHTFRYTQHLDWHFRQNRREKSQHRKALSRRLYYDLSDWIQFEEMEDLEERGVSIFEPSAALLGGPTGNELDGDLDGLLGVNGGKRVLNPDSYTVLAAGHEGATCPQCGEEFESFYDEEKEEWRLRDATLDETLENKLYHPICHQDYLAAASAVGVSEETGEQVMDVSVDEEDEVQILKEGKKDVVLDVMDIDIEEDEPEGIDSTDSSPAVVTIAENSPDAMNKSPRTPDVPDPSSQVTAVPERSYTILSPKPILTVDLDENISSNVIPGITNTQSSDNGVDDNSIFSIVLDENSNSGLSFTKNPDKVIVYENMRFDFPKIKTEPIEWDDIPEEKHIQTTRLESRDEGPITIDDDEEEETPNPEPQLVQDEVDLTADEPEAMDTGLPSTITAQIDGNLMFTGNSLGGGASVVPVPSKIRINITGLDTTSSGQPGSGSPSSSAGKSPGPSSVVPESSVTSSAISSGSSPQPLDLDALFNSESMKKLKPRLAGRKFTNCPPKKDKKNEESGLCSIM